MIKAEDNDNIEQYRDLAKEMLEVSRFSLMKKLRFLDRALFRMPLLVSEKVMAYGTNGRMVWFQPQSVFEDYKKEKNLLTHGFLHMVLHCIYCHPFQSQQKQQAFWNGACDMAVEKTILELDLPETTLEKDGYRRGIVAQLEEDMRDMIAPNDDSKAAKTLAGAFRPGRAGKIGKKRPIMMTADTIYDYFIRFPEMGEAYLQEMYSGKEDDFSFDDHQQWLAKDIFSVKEAAEAKEYRTDVATGMIGCHEAETGEEEGTFEEDIHEVLAGQGQSQWEDIGKQAQNDLTVSSKEKGSGIGNMLQNLRSLQKETYDYGDFLRRFAVLGEEVHINPEEFDYIYYTYGLQLYGKMPLLEPLEYREAKRIREFVIAIDTSGSCKGETVRNFLNKTYNILTERESFFEKIHLHIIQCDEKIQKDHVITGREDFRQLMENLPLKGFGGTDFRPVFRYVDGLLERHEFQQLKGLIYFTDGYGTFPEAMPDYETAFVFVNDGYAIPEVPSWAVQLILEEDAF